ncbi:MAG: cyclic nucleotide-binding domain-containing protein [Anaerolinea sp.]|nr:cyclic nucleotide-binding domain-containing protein [Anaerolinea sp.]
MTVAEELKSFSLFKNVDLTDLEALAAMMKPQSLAAGQQIFRKGDPGDSMMLIRRGRIRVYIIDDHGREIVFRHYGSGQIVGEFAIIDSKPRSASAAAVEPTDVLVLERHDFLTYLRDRPILGVEMMRSLAERIRYTTQYLEKLERAITALSNSDYDQALREIALSASQDEIQPLILSFLDMVKSVQERDQRLKRTPSQPGDHD